MLLAGVDPSFVMYLLLMQKIKEDQGIHRKPLYLAQFCCGTTISHRLWVYSTCLMSFAGVYSQHIRNMRELMPQAIPDASKVEKVARVI